MIQSENEYYEAMRDMIRKVQHGYEPPFTADAEELEILSDCIKAGYLIGKTTYIDMYGIEQESRTMDGKIHPELINHIVTPKGLAFLNVEELSSEEERTAQGKDEKKHPAKKIFHAVKLLLEWTATIFTIIGGWSIVKALISFIRSLFD